MLQKKNTVIEFSELYQNQYSSSVNFYYYYASLKDFKVSECDQLCHENAKQGVMYKNNFWANLDFMTFRESERDSKIVDETVRKQYRRRFHILISTYELLIAD